MSGRNSGADKKAPIASWRSVAAIIDHTNLRPEATPDQIVRLCEEAREFGFGTVMVNPCYIGLASSNLQNSEVKVGAVVGFPLGATLASVKIFETTEALKLGAREIDMVLNIGALKAGNHALVLSDISGVADVVHEQKALLKVILETGLLDREEKLAADTVTKIGATKTKYGVIRKIQVVSEDTTSSLWNSFQRSRYGWRRLGLRLLWTISLNRESTPE
jgi:deoxyribose-phosphate aldolase